MAETEDKKDIQSPFQQILQKLGTMESTIKSLQEENTAMKAQFKEFSDFNASLLNSGSGQPTTDATDEAKLKRRQYLDDICRKGAMK